MSRQTVTGWRRTMVRSSRPRPTAWKLALPGWMVCSTAWGGTLEGTATYRERLELPAEALFKAVALK